jgi:hypothetical protein
MTDVELKVTHFILAIVILLLFSKLSFDAVVLGAVALVIYSKLIAND